MSPFDVTDRCKFGVRVYVVDVGVFEIGSGPSVGPILECGAKTDQD